MDQGAAMKLNAATIAGRVSVFICSNRNDATAGSGLNIAARKRRRVAWFLLAWLDCQEWGAVWNDQHCNCRGGFRFAGALGHGVERARRIKEALARVYFLNRLAFDCESRGTSV